MYEKPSGDFFHYPLQTEFEILANEKDFKKRCEW